MAMNDTKKPLVLAEFSEGYTLRNLIEYLKGINKFANFRFTSKGIYYLEANEVASVLNEVEIGGHSIIVYEYRSHEKEEVIGINLEHLRSITKSIGKKDGVRLSLAKDKLSLEITIISSNSKESTRRNVSRIKTMNVEEFIFEKDVFKLSATEPTCKSTSQEFSKTCATMAAIKCKYISISGGPKNILFNAVIDGDIVVSDQIFGPEQEWEVSGQEMIISTSVIKALSKITNLSSGGNVKMFWEEGLPVRFISNIGNYGTITIHVKEENKGEK